MMNNPIATGRRALCCLALALGCAMMLTATTGVLAQSGLGPFNLLGSNLTDEDVTMMRENSSDLYTNEELPVGTTRAWRNKDSGNAGLATLIRRYEYRGMKCRTVRHQLTLRASIDPSTLYFDRCLTASGEWKLR